MRIYKFWEELINYFPFITIILFDIKVGNTLICIYVCLMKSIKQYNLRGFRVGIIDNTDL
jgi:hypothetical protein